jgi:3-hydroxyacyl-[acyl-carrier-protein] dehydratase
VAADATFTIAADHPALDGHFPGDPVVPGVVVLEQVQRALEGRIGPLRLTGLPQVKFHSPLRPGETCVVSFGDLGATHVHFDCRSGTRAIARGTLRFEADARDAG